VNLFFQHQLAPKENAMKQQVFKQALEQGGNILITYYDQVALLLFRMNQQKIDWAEAQRLFMDQVKIDQILAGLKAILLHPEILPNE
jgi:capsule polysaccharide modification protein KpsS